MRKFTILSIVVLLLSGFTLKSQELSCRVSVSASNLDGAYKKRALEMEKQISSFLNGRQWGPFDYKDEKIECNFFLNLNSVESSDLYTASLQIQVSRPVFGSAYKTTLLNLKDDDISFSFNSYEPLIFSGLSKMDDLPAVLAFYANIIIGTDLDSFSFKGGEALFNAAQNIVDNMQSSGSESWNGRAGNDSRFRLIETLLDDSYRAYREAVYNYSINGLDKMAQDLESRELAIATVHKVLQQMPELNRRKRDLYLVKIFFDARGDEIVSLFKDSDTEVFNSVLSILSECSPYSAMKLKEGSSIKK